MRLGKVRRRDMLIFAGLFVVSNWPRTLYKFGFPLGQRIGFPWLVAYRDYTGDGATYFYWQGVGLDLLVWAAALLAFVFASKFSNRHTNPVDVPSPKVTRT